MSHVAIVNVKIKNLDILEKTLQDMGLELRRGVKTFKAYSVNNCDHAIRMPNVDTYEIGVIKDKKEDHYNLGYDDYGKGRHIMEAVGKGCTKLIDEYSKNVAIAAAQTYASNKGYTTTTETNDNGETVITLRRYTA